MFRLIRFTPFLKLFKQQSTVHFIMLPLVLPHYIEAKTKCFRVLGFDPLPCLPMMYPTPGPLHHPTVHGEWCTVFQSQGTYIIRDSVWRLFPALQLPEDTAWGAELVGSQIFISEFFADHGITRDMYTARQARVKALPNSIYNTKYTTIPWADFNSASALT